MCLLWMMCASVLSAAALHTSVRLHISLCPLVYYGKPYHHLHMNYTPEGLFICMDEFLSWPITGDCIQMPSVTSDPVVLVSAAAPGIQSEQLERHFPKLQQSGTPCGVEVHLRFRPGNTSVFRMFNFRDLSVLQLEPLDLESTVSFYVKGQLWSLWIIGAVSNHSFFLPAGCRLGDSVMRPNSSINRDSCTDTKCDTLGRIHVSSCGGQQTCIGHHCSLDLLCSLLGPMVVDFSGSVLMIPNRCTFVLLETAYVSIRAVFRDRRRQDLVFLESLSFKIQNDTFLLQQGKLSLNGQLLVLSFSPREYSGVEVFKRDLGITVRTTNLRLKLTLESDGTTAQITCTGLDSSYIRGLCSDSLNITGNTIHTQGCDTEYQEAPDPSINLAVVTQRCHFFLKDVGSPCHLKVNPRPFVRSCLELFSFYPDRDGMFCQLLDSYSRACSLHGLSLDMGAAFGCVGASYVCQDFFCSEHEFCGISPKGAPYCRCRAIYAAPFRESRTYNLPVDCGKNSSSLSLVTCLLEDTPFSPLDLHLLDPTCKGQMDPVTHMLRFSFNHSHNQTNCGSLVLVNKSHTIYTNTVMMSHSSSSFIQRQLDFKLSIECYHLHEEELSLQVMLTTQNVNQTVQGELNQGKKESCQKEEKESNQEEEQELSQEEEYNEVIVLRDVREMALLQWYLDPALIRQVSPQTNIPVGTRVWAALTLKQEDGHRLIKSSWATPSSATPSGVTPPRATPPRATPPMATSPMATSPRATLSLVTQTWAPPASTPPSSVPPSSVPPSSAPPSSAPPSSATASLQHFVPRRDLIVERCASAGPADVVVERNNGESRSVFSFDMFCFEGFPPGIILHHITEKCEGDCSQKCP